MTAPVLYPGDKIHLMLFYPSSADAKRLSWEMEELYRMQGVDVAIKTVVTADNIPHSMQILAVFRSKP